jgi:hypothetical protein
LAPVEADGRAAELSHQKLIAKTLRHPLHRVHISFPEPHPVIPLVLDIRTNPDLLLGFAIAGLQVIV